jgi:hypothetical protein
VRRLRRCLKFEGLERAKKNSPFLALCAKRCSNNFFALSAPNLQISAQKKGRGTGTGSTCRCAARPSYVGE